MIDIYAPVVHGIGVRDHKVFAEDSVRLIADSPRRLEVGETRVPDRRARVSKKATCIWWTIAVAFSSWIR